MASETVPPPATAVAGRGPAWKAELLALKRKVYTGYLVAASLVVTMLVVFQVLDFDPRSQQVANVMVALWLVIAVGAIVAMHRRPRTVLLLERMLYFVAYPLYLGTGAVLMSTGDDPARQVGYVEAIGQWLPISYIWAYIAFGTRRGLLASGALLAAFVLTVSLGAAYGPHGEVWASTLPAAALYLTSSAVLILALLVMWTFVELQARGRAAAETLARLATEDSLTGLPNRRALEAQLAHDLVVARRDRRLVVCYFLDLDDLKSVNDTYGHQGGDELIVRYAQRLRSSVRASDIVARISGDEFVVAGFVGSKDDAEALARKLLGATAEPFPIAGDHVVTVGASIGMSLFPDHAADVPGLIRSADVAMYGAKLSGKNRWRSASAVGADAPGTLVTETGGGGTDVDEVLRR